MTAIAATIWVNNGHRKIWQSYTTQHNRNSNSNGKPTTKYVNKLLFYGSYSFACVI